MSARISIATAFMVVVFGATLLPAAAHGQATRTWVSGVGDDVNPCSRTAPCRTFAGSLQKTAAGGEINALDSGPYGAVTITKAITIDATGALGGVLHSSNGITVNAGPADDVVLRGLDVNGAGAGAAACPNIAGLSGIVLLGGRSLTVEDTTVRRNTTAGLQLTPQANDAKVLVDNVSIGPGCQHGINAAPAAGRRLSVMVRDTTISNTQTALQAGGGAHVGLAGSTIFGNGTGLLTSGGGLIDDLGGNQLFGNVVNGTPSNAPRALPPTPAAPAPAPAPLVRRAVTVCAVPRLVGLRLSTARARLRRAHCSLGKVRRRTTRQRRRVGRVLAQGVGAGRKLAENAKVGVTVGRRRAAR